MILAEDALRAQLARRWIAALIFEKPCPAVGTNDYSLGYHSVHFLGRVVITLTIHAAKLLEAWSSVVMQLSRFEDRMQNVACWPLLPRNT
jgi:hypothetical protein